jgi:hypothetical protein
MLTHNMHEYSISGFRLKTCVWEKGAEGLYEELHEINVASHLSATNPSSYKLQIENSTLYRQK